MKIFIGGASEDSENIREIEAWVSENDHDAWPWDKPGTFTIGTSTFPRLIEISRQVQAAILIFSPADLIYYRGDAAGQPRDNVLVEYGLFASALGPERCAIALVGDSKVASDLAGISVLDFRGKRKPRGRIELNIWLRKLTSNPIDPAVAKQIATNEKLRNENAELKDALVFEKENSRKLKSLLESENVINFHDLSLDKYWKLLFDYSAVNSIADGIKDLIGNPQDLRNILESSGIYTISEAIAWGHSESETENTNPQENGKFCRKALRAFKMLGTPNDIQQFVDNADRGVGAAFRNAAEQHLSENS
ncbi:MAG: nucleotide-binding protein [Thiolinea sp.]